ncbi:conserved hypothetical protein [Burkholderia cepacia]
MPVRPTSVAGGSAARAAQRDFAEHREILFAAAVRKRVEQVVAHDARHRQRHRHGVAGFQRQANVLQPEARLEARRLVAPLGDHRAVTLVDGPRKHAAGDHVEEVAHRDAVRAQQRGRLAERLDRRREREVRGDLRDVRVLRQRTEPPGLLADRVEQRLHAVDRLGRAARHDRQARGGRDIGAPHHRRGDVMDAARRMRVRERFGQRDRHRRHVDVDQAARRLREQRFVEDLARGGIVGQHREHRVAAKRVGRRVDDLRADRGQRLGALARSVPDPHRVSGLQQVRRDCLPHFAQPDKSEIHFPLLRSVKRGVKHRCGVPAGHAAGHARCHTARMATATFRFHDELNAFLPRAQRDRAFGHACARDATVKHAIEALGVPHTEIGRLCINDVPAALDRPLDDGDRVEAFPERAQPAARGVAAPPTAQWRFVADAHLGGLAQLLRLAGFDTCYDNHYRDDELAALAARGPDRADPRPRAAQAACGRARLLPARAAAGRPAARTVRAARSGTAHAPVPVMPALQCPAASARRGRRRAARAGRRPAAAPALRRVRRVPARVLGRLPLAAHAHGGRRDARAAARPARRTGGIEPLKKQNPACRSMRGWPTDGRQRRPWRQAAQFCAPASFVPAADAAAAFAWPFFEPWCFSWCFGLL